jgi:CRISPR/Cas system-associated endonuclease Cas3-HD
VDARGKGISEYQFRAPGEWFSELYSAYYLKAISKSHADYKWFTEKVHKVVPEAAKK